VDKLYVDSYYVDMDTVKLKRTQYWREKKREQRARKKKELGDIPQSFKDALGELERGEVESMDDILMKPGEEEEARRAYRGQEVPKDSLAADLVAPVRHDLTRLKPAEASDLEWEMCLERAERARKHALAMPEHFRATFINCQDPLWQWENEVKKRVVRLRG
jgi:hypothetical protein